MVDKDSVSKGQHEYTCLCGWIDWSHATPDREDLVDLWSQLPHVVKKNQKPLRLRPVANKTAYFVSLDTSLSLIGTKRRAIRSGVLGHTTFHFQVPNRGANEYWYRRYALYIYQQGCEHLEHLQVTTEARHHSVYSFEDLVSNLLAFYGHVYSWNREDAIRRCGGWTDKKLALKNSLDVVAAMEAEKGLWQEELKSFSWDKAFLFNDLCGACQPYQRRGFLSLPERLRSITPLQCRALGSSLSPRDARRGFDPAGDSPGTRRFARQGASTGRGRGVGRAPGPVHA